MEVDNPAAKAAEVGWKLRPESMYLETFLPLPPPLSAMRLLTCRPFLLTDEVIDLITLEVIPLPSVNQPSTVFSWPVAIAPVVWLSSFPVSFNKAEKGCYRHSMQRFCLLKDTRGLQKHKPEAYHLLRNEQASFRRQSHFHLVVCRGMWSVAWPCRPIISAVKTSTQWASYYCRGDESFDIVGWMAFSFVQQCGFLGMDL